jgi:alpha-glucosidase (family GH31 glycosyl hydrolase)
VLARHAELDGKPPVPPPFVFAPWNDAVRGAANVRAVAQKLRQNHVPSSAIWTEDWAGGEASGDQYHLTYDWTVDRALYPDAEALADELHGAGFKWLGYFNTFAPTDGDHFRPEYLIHHDDGTPYLFDSVQFGKQSSLVDLANPAAADWMAQAMRAALAIGFDGWMADYGEWMPVDLAGEAAHQQYPVAWQKLNERVLGDDQIAFVRSGFTGSQAIAHQVVWAGDQSTDFDVGDGLPSVLPIELGLGVAGLPFVGSDVAGYMTTGGHPAATKELFFRWSVLGALSPLMRTHHGAAPDQNWRFDSDDETLAHWKRWATVHTQLHPLLLAAATEASRTGAPLVRQLALGFPDDAVAWGVADEYLLGPSLLVAPVLQMGQTARPVYLPAGHWVRLFGPPLVVEGPTQVMVDAPLGELPVFAPAGALLVLLPPTVETLTGALPETREVIAVLGADGRFDEGTRSWTLTSSRAPSSGAAVTFNGAMVGAIGAGRALDVTISGNGTLAIADGSATLVVGGAADQTVHLIW